MSELPPADTTRPRKFREGSICKVRGLDNRSEMNGRHVEILTTLETVNVPQFDGPTLAYGIVYVTNDVLSGYMRPQNLELVYLDPTAMQVRAIWLHETGTEGPFAE